MKKFTLGLVSLACLAAAPASAAVNIVIEGGGTPIVYEGENGNRFAVFGIDARQQDSDNIVNLPNVTVDNSYIQSLITSGASQFVNAFLCTNGEDCAAFTSVNVADEARLFGSLLLEFSGTGNIVFSKPSGGTATLGLGITQQGLPPIGDVTAAVPEPSTWAMMLLGFFAIGFGMRARKTAIKTTVAYA